MVYPQKRCSDGAEWSGASQLKDLKDADMHLGETGWSLLWASEHSPTHLNFHLRLPELGENGFPMVLSPSNR